MRSTLLIIIEQYHNGWLEVSVVTDEKNLETARDTSPASSSIPANAIRFNIQAGQEHEASDTVSKVLIDLKADWASELEKIQQVHACQEDGVLADYRRIRTGGEHDALIPLAEEKQTRKQSWFRDTCGDLFTTCNSAVRMGI